MLAERNTGSRRPQISRLLKEEGGQDLAEYGMLAALIAVVAIVALTALGGKMIVLWTNITTAFAGLP